MFKKLLSNLPFNPSLIGELSFYARRVRQEAVVRRAGLIVLCLAVALQVFAVVSPPQPSLARSNNDMIVGGITSASEAVNACKQNTYDYKTALAYYGISCTDIAATTTVNLKSTDFDKRLYSMGHLAYGKTGETPVSIPNMSTMYLRYLWSWDTGSASTYKALKGTTSNGLTFYILYNCGNLTFIGLPKPAPTPTPETPKDVCSNITGIQTKPEQCDVCPINVGVQTSMSECDLCPNLAGVQTTGQCDVCPNISGMQSQLSECDQCPAISGVQLTKAECDLCPNVSGVQSDAAECDVCSKIPGIQTSKSECDVCPSIPGEQSSESQCRSCTQSQTRDDLTACLEYSKTVSNVTQTIGNANGTTAKPGDVLRYTLTTTNKGVATIKKFVVNENISDVLDYATLLDTSGGTKSSDNILSWPGADLKGGQSVIRTFTVKVKDPLPSTPISSTDPGHFDMVMTNVYGNTTSVKLPPSITKTTEMVSTKLPNTGPGASLVIAFVLVSFVSYLFARTRLLAKELDIVRSDIANEGVPA